MIKAGSMTMKMEFPKALYGLAPALISAPAFASVDVSKVILLASSTKITLKLPILINFIQQKYLQAITTTMPLSLEVTFAAYLAVLLGTFVPVTFLIVLYSQVAFISIFTTTDDTITTSGVILKHNITYDHVQSEARKAGLREGKTK
jgi:hypothetical protein